MSTSSAPVENHTSHRIDSYSLKHDSIYTLANVHLHTVLGNRPSASSVAALATQLALVILGIRSGYLLDGFAVDGACLAPFIDGLKSEAPSDLAAYYEESTEQVFFVNVLLLRERIHKKEFPLWISTASPPRKTTTPDSFIQSLEKLSLDAGCVHRFTVDDPLDLIPLAAFLLEYPVGYVVESPSQATLTDVTLSVLEIYLSSPRERRVALIKFSVPENCEHECLPSIDTKAFCRRLERYPSLGEVSIDRSVKYFDRVAL